MPVMPNVTSGLDRVLRKIEYPEKESRQITANGVKQIKIRNNSEKEAVKILIAYTGRTFSFQLSEIFLLNKTDLAFFEFMTIPRNFFLNGSNSINSQATNVAVTINQKFNHPPVCSS